MQQTGRVEDDLVCLFGAVGSIQDMERVIGQFELVRVGDLLFPFAVYARAGIDRGQHVDRHPAALHESLEITVDPTAMRITEPVAFGKRLKLPEAVRIKAPHVELPHALFADHDGARPKLLLEVRLATKGASDWIRVKLGVHILRAVVPVVGETSFRQFWEPCGHLLEIQAFLLDPNVFVRLPPLRMTTMRLKLAA